MSYNKVLLIGNVGQDPTLSFNSQSNQLEKATFSMATTERHRTRDGEKSQSTEWHRIVVWAPLANIIESYVKKGSQLFVEGKLMTRTFDREGQKHFITEVHVINLRLFGKTESDSSP